MSKNKRRYNTIVYKQGTPPLYPVGSGFHKRIYNQDKLVDPGCQD